MQLRAGTNTSVSDARPPLQHAAACCARAYRHCRAAATQRHAQLGDGEEDDVGRRHRRIGCRAARVVATSHLTRLRRGGAGRGEAGRGGLRLRRDGGSSAAQRRCWARTAAASMRAPVQRGLPGGPAGSHHRAVIDEVYFDRQPRPESHCAHLTGRPSAIISVSGHKETSRVSRVSYNQLESQLKLPQPTIQHRQARAPPTAAPPLQPPTALPCTGHAQRETPGDNGTGGA